MFRKSLLVLLPLVISACDSSQPNYSAANTKSAPPPATVEAPPPAAAPKPVATTPPPTPPVVATPAPKPPEDPYKNRYVSVPAGKMGSFDKLGVGGCDDYVERYRTCFNNTEIAREQKFELRRTLTQQMRQWKADTAAGKISKVAAACSAAESKARADFAKVGCGF